MKEDLRVLIVEDEALIAILLERHIQKLGARVVGKVIFGEEVLGIWQSTRPDIILMDIRLAGAMNGMDAARVVLSQGPARIAFMTAYGTEQVKAEIDTIRHVAFMEKPVSMDKLKDLLEKID